jgi:hypothetical protein
MNSELEMLIEKLQMLCFGLCYHEMELFWLRQWNQFGGLKEVQNSQSRDF